MTHPLVLWGLLFSLNRQNLRFFCQNRGVGDAGLAQELRVSPRTVRRWRLLLCAEGWLHEVPHPDGIEWVADVPPPPE